jgi:hypothetical protein
MDVRIYSMFVFACVGSGHAMGGSPVQGNPDFQSLWSIMKSDLYNFFLIGIMGAGVQTGSTRHVGHFWPIEPLPRVIVRVENLVEWWLAGETEILGETLP